ncbi:hypothetical protein MW887_001910 [Aspergillus wentii]|nr:hypothetical protein MW887_001910 [Aspergillus wentii]
MKIRISKDEGNKNQQEPFSVHENLVRTSSRFFDKAMAGKWRESLQRTVKLPDEEPNIFTLYLHWLYYGALPVYCDKPGLAGNSEYLELAKAYVLGDKLLDSKFQDTVIDAIIEKSLSKAKDGASWYPVGEVIDDWLRDYNEPENVPQPFLLKLASKLLDRRVKSGFDEGGL